MSLVNIINIIPKNPIDKYNSILNFEIIFECLAELKNDIEWKLIYIGKADDPTCDQELGSVLIGPLQIGQMKFDFEADVFPNFSKIPKEDVLGVTAIILTCSYLNQEFFRVGYYVNNIYSEQELNENPPEDIIIDKVMRYILSDKPRITKFNISWDENKNSENDISNLNVFDEGMNLKSNLNEIKNDFKNIKDN